MARIGTAATNERDPVLILAGDIGGTNSRFAFFSPEGGRLVNGFERVYDSTSAPGVEALIERFCAEAGLRPTVASFGIAGPVRDGRCKTTNLPWIVDRRDLARLLSLPYTGLINDLEAYAYGLKQVAPGDIVVLQEGIPSAGNAALIAAGTGLGEAGLFWDGAAHRPWASEGGHASFAPESELEIALLQFLAVEFGHVSWERVVSGPGLANIYRFLRDTGRGIEPPWLGAAFEAEAGAAVSHAALADPSDAGHAPLAADALGLFVRLFGREAGLLALKAMAVAGVYIGGGIAPKILPALTDGRFAESFRGASRMRDLLSAIPIYVVTADKTALAGAAHHATVQSRA